MGKKTPMEMVLICALSFLGILVVYKLGIFAHELIQNGLRAWEETPRSTKYIYYGLLTALVNAGIVYGIGNLFAENIENWLVTTKVIWQLLIYVMLAFWAGAAVFGFLEKIGGLPQ